MGTARSLPAAFTLATFPITASASNDGIIVTRILNYCPVRFKVFQDRFPVRKNFYHLKIALSACDKNHRIPYQVLFRMWIQHEAALRSLR
jgi:hypothetical protein